MGQGSGELLARNRNLRRTRALPLPRLVSGELDVSELDIAGVEHEYDCEPRRLFPCLGEGVEGED